MCSKSVSQCFAMPKYIYSISLLAIGVVFYNCGGNNADTKNLRPMVYEGMPINDLSITLGKPDSIEPGGTIYNADYNKTQKVVKWYYDERTVVIIDDTVKTPNLEER